MVIEDLVRLGQRLADSSDIAPCVRWPGVRHISIPTPANPRPGDPQNTLPRRAPCKLRRKKLLLWPGGLSGLALAARRAGTPSQGMLAPSVLETSKTALSCIMGVHLRLWRPIKMIGR